MDLYNKMEELAAVVTDKFNTIDVDDTLEEAKRTINSVAAIQKFNDFMDSEDLLGDTIDLLTPKSFKLSSENIPADVRAQADYIYNKQKQAQDTTLDEIKALNIFQKYKDNIPDKAIAKILEYNKGTNSFRDAVKQYQNDIGVEADGYFGKNSIKASRKSEGQVTAPIKTVENSYTVKEGDTLSKIAKELGVPQSNLVRSSKSKYLQIGETLGIRGVKPEELDLGGTKDEEAGVFSKAADWVSSTIFDNEKAVGGLDDNTYIGRFVSALASKANPFSKQEWKNEDFSNKFLNKLHTAVVAAGKNMEVGEKKVVSPEFVSRLFGHDGYGYGQGNIQKDTGDKEIDLLRKGIGNFTLTKTKDGYEVYDMYDFKPGTDDNIKGDKNSLFRVGHRLGEKFLPDGEGIKINIKLPANRSTKYKKA